MTDLISLNNFDLFLVGMSMAAMAILGVVIFLNNRKSITNISFLVLSISAIFWSILNYFSYKYLDYNISLILIRLQMFFAIFYAFSIFNLFHFFPAEKIKSSNLYNFFIIPISVIGLVLSLTKYIFKNIENIDFKNSIISVGNGPLIPAFGIIVLILLIFGIYIFIKKMLLMPKEEKGPYKIMLFGLSTTFLLHIIFNFIFPAVLKNQNFIAYSGLFPMPFLGATFYAITKHNLLNIKIIGTEFLVFLLSLLTLFEVLTQKSIAAIAFRFIIFTLVLIIGIFLIRSVRKEVEQKEQLAKLDKDLEEKNKKLEELNAFKSQFLSFASHQIKTPVAVIKGFAGLIYDGSYGQVPDKIKEVVGRIKEVSDQMVVLLNNFLDLRRIDEGRMEYAFAKNNIVALAKEIVADLQIMANNKKLQLTGEYETDEINANVDQDKFRQVIQNLVENAIKYTEAGSIKVNIKKENNSALICVSDTGRGMDKSLLPNLFNQFNRDPKAAKEIAGTGLGLYIAKQITLAHKGEIWAESEGEGKGSKFCVKVSLEN